MIVLLSMLFCSRIQISHSLEDDKLTGGFGMLQDRTYWSSFKRNMVDYQGQRH